jgi:membrane dipeptidase
VNRRRFLRTGLLGGAALLGAPMLNFGRFRLFAEAPAQVSRRAADLVLGSRVIDMLSLLTLDWPLLFRWQAAQTSFFEPDFRRLEVSGIDVFHPAVDTMSADPRAGALVWVDGWRRLLGSQACFLELIDSLDAIERARQAGKLGVVIGFQNSTHFHTVADVAHFHGLGQRVSQLTYNTRNALGSGCYEATDRGLSAFGHRVVGEMDRLGMAVDVSHCGERTALDAVAASRRPVLITHGNCRALVPGQPRCRSDELIRAVARSGGVMGITVVRAFVSGKRRPALPDLLDHFDHVARLAGVEHVGLGSDVDVGALDPATGRLNPFYDIVGLDPVARIFQIADGLLGRGWSEPAVRLVLGGNFERALGGIWGAAGRAHEVLARDPFCPARSRRVPPVRERRDTLAGRDDSAGDGGRGSGPPLR